MQVSRRETSTSNPGWLILFLVLAVVVTTVWFRESDDGPLHRVRTTVQAVVAPVSAGGEWATRPVRGFFAWVGDLGVSRSQLEQLRDQNTRLRAAVSELEEDRIENIRLRDLVKISEANTVESIGARVIGRPSNQWEGVITIDRGTSDGVKAGMPVVGAQGLLGQTVSVTARSAKVRLITDQNSGVAGMVQRTRAEGIVKGRIDGTLTLDFVSVETTVKPGDVVMTSGMGGVYPKGLVIGEVLQVEADASAVFQSIQLTPASELNGLEEVLVLIGAPPAVTTEGGE